jgi:hypothetical protein
MKTVDTNTSRQPNYSIHKDEVDPAYSIIVEIDALWRMSDGYRAGVDSCGGTSMRDEGYVIVASNRKAA